MGENYINTNKKCYNAFADDYQARYNAGEMAKQLVRIINKALKEKVRKYDYRILELGCGTGNILEGFKILQEKFHNKYKYNLYAIDFSKKMIAYAKDKYQDANIVNKNALTLSDNILSLPFKKKEKFDIIIMVAFIHLFPRKDAEKLLNNIKGLLNPNGLIYIDTTKASEFKDGEITEKQGKIIDEQGNIISMPRLRTYWTEESFEKFLDNCGFEIIKDYSDNHESNRGKIWLQRIVKLK